MEVESLESSSSRSILSSDEDRPQLGRKRPRLSQLQSSDEDEIEEDNSFSAPQLPGSSAPQLLSWNDEASAQKCSGAFRSTRPEAKVLRSSAQGFLRQSSNSVSCKAHSSRAQAKSSASLLSSKLAASQQAKPTISSVHGTTTTFSSSAPQLLSSSTSSSAQGTATTRADGDVIDLVDSDDDALTGAQPAERSSGTVPSHMQQDSSRFKMQTGAGRHSEGEWSGSTGQEASSRADPARPSSESGRTDLGPRHSVFHSNEQASSNFSGHPVPAPAHRQAQIQGHIIENDRRRKFDVFDDDEELEEEPQDLGEFSRPDFSRPQEPRQSDVEDDPEDLGEFSRPDHSWEEEEEPDDLGEFSRPEPAPSSSSSGALSSNNAQSGAQRIISRPTSGLGVGLSVRPIPPPKPSPVPPPVSPAAPSTVAQPAHRIGNQFSHSLVSSHQPAPAYVNLPGRPQPQQHGVQPRPNFPASDLRNFPAPSGAASSAAEPGNPLGRPQPAMPQSGPVRLGWHDEPEEPLMEFSSDDDEQGHGSEGSDEQEESDDELGDVPLEQLLPNFRPLTDEEIAQSRAAASSGSSGRGSGRRGAKSAARSDGSRGGGPADAELDLSGLSSQARRFLEEGEENSAPKSRKGRGKP